MHVVGLAAPAVLILWTIVDQQQEAGAGEAGDEAIRASTAEVIRVEPGRAICSIRAGRWVVCPTAV